MGSKLIIVLINLTFRAQQLSYSAIYMRAVLYPNLNSTQTSCCNLLHNKHYEHRLHPEKLILVSMLWKTGDSTEILPQFGCSLSCRYKMESRLKHFIYYCLDLYRCFIYFRFMFRGLK